MSAAPWFLAGAVCGLVACAWLVRIAVSNLTLLLTAVLDAGLELLLALQANAPAEHRRAFQALRDEMIRIQARLPKSYTPPRER